MKHSTPMETYTQREAYEMTIQILNFVPEGSIVWTISPNDIPLALSTLSNPLLLPFSADLLGLPGGVEEGGGGIVAPGGAGGRKETHGTEEEEEAGEAVLEEAADESDVCGV